MRRDHAGRPAHPAGEHEEAVHQDCAADVEPEVQGEHQDTDCQGVGEKGLVDQKGVAVGESDRDPVPLSGSVTCSYLNGFTV